MKIMIYCPVFYPQNSGYANAFLSLVKILASNGVNVDVVTPQNINEKDEILIKNCSIYRINNNSLVDLKKIKVPILKQIIVAINYFYQPFIRYKQVRSFIEDVKYDLIVFETIEDILLLYYLPAKFFRKILVRIHGTEETEGVVYKKDFLSRTRYFFTKSVLRNKVKFIASTNNFYNIFIKKYFLDENVFDIAEKNFFILPNTLTSDNTSIHKENTEIEENIKIVTLGRLDREGFLQKGFEDFVNGLILCRNMIENTDITIIGSGKFLNYLKKKTTMNSLKINFIENLSHEETIAFLRKSDLVVLLSRFEGHSMFALEAIAYSNAVIFSNVGGLIDMVDKNGYLVESQNLDEFTDKFIKILSDKNKLKEMKMRSREVYNKYFSNQSIYIKFEQISKVIGSSLGFDE